MGDRCPHIHEAVVGYVVIVTSRAVYGIVTALEMVVRDIGIATADSDASITSCYCASYIEAAYVNPIGSDIKDMVIWI